MVLGLAGSIRSRTSSTPARAAKYAASSALKLLSMDVSVEDMNIMPAAMAVISISASIVTNSELPLSRSRFVFFIPRTPFDPLVVQPSLGSNRNHWIGLADNVHIRGNHIGGNLQTTDAGA